MLAPSMARLTVGQRPVGSSPERTSGSFVGLLFLSVSLIAWGPPPLRGEGRGLEAALESPFALDAAGLTQVGVWIGAVVVVCAALTTRVLRPSPPLSALLLREPALRWYSLFAAVALCSAVYSVVPLYSIYFAAKIWIVLLAAALLASHGSPRAPLAALYMTSVLQTLAIGVLYLTSPDLVGELSGLGGQDGYRLHGGILRDYGSSALLASLLCLRVIFFSKERRARLAPMFGLPLFVTLAVFSRTRSTLAVLLLFFVIMIAGHPSTGRRLRLLVFVVLGTVGLWLVGVAGPITFFAARHGVGFDTLSGRSVAFSYLLERWHESPIGGLGFAAGSRSALVDFVYSSGLGIGAGHDLVSTALVDVGLLGAVLVFLALLASWLAVWRTFRVVRTVPALRSTWLEVVCLLTWITLWGLVNASIARASLPFVVACLLLGHIASRAPDRRVTGGVADPRGEGDAARGMWRGLA